MKKANFLIRSDRSTNFLILNCSVLSVLNMGGQLTHTNHYNVLTLTPVLYTLYTMYTYIYLYIYMYYIYTIYTYTRHHRYIHKRKCTLKTSNKFVKIMFEKYGIIRKTLRKEMNSCHKLNFLIPLS